MASFMDVLEELCRLPGARGAVFVDYEGECIQQVTVDQTLSKYDLSVAGAYATPILSGIMKCNSLRVLGNEGAVFIRVVQDLYAVVLVAERSVLAARAQYAMDRAAGQLLALM